jgi:N-methylhydantoinase A
MTFEEAEERPFETILSGPVAGAVGAAELARRLGLAEVISADVGGTSFDTCLISDGRPQVMYQGEVVGLPVQTTWVDVRSIGAGGGSIAYVDEGGLLRVGPQSAGAEPGPVSYGKGGTEPTVTDAALVLGMLAEGSLAGNISLDREEAEAAFAPLAGALGVDTEEVARGVITIAAASQADAIREITVERGRDPRRGTLMTFGGAGPLFATLLARELEIREVVVPAHAGSFSAWGLLGADLTQAGARTRIMRLDERALADANAALAEIFAAIASRSGNSQARDDGEREVGLDMRYVGQEYTLSVPVRSEGGRVSASVGDILAAFHREYERTFGHTMDEEVEIVSLRATVRTPLPRRRELHLSGRRPGASRQLGAWSFARDQWLSFEVLDQDSLHAGDVVPGPAIILQQTATTYLDADLEARLDASGCLFLTEGKERR